MVINRKACGGLKFKRFFPVEHLCSKCKYHQKKKEIKRFFPKDSSHLLFLSFNTFIKHLQYAINREQDIFAP
jgi:hypothetical protein